MPDEVKCADCGFLAVRHTQTRQLLNAESSLRERGYIQSLSPNGMELAYDDFPICFKRVVNFNTEEEAGLSKDEGLCCIAVHKPRQCDQFMPWEQGFTPKEHAEMVREEARLKWQAEREAADRRWRLTELIVMGVIVTIVSALVQLAAAFIERGSWFPDRQAVVSTLPTPPPR